MVPIIGIIIGADEDAALVKNLRESYTKRYKGVIINGDPALNPSWPGHMFTCAAHVDMCLLKQVPTDPRDPPAPLRDVFLNQKKQENNIGLISFWLKRFSLDAPARCLEVISMENRCILGENYECKCHVEIGIKLSNPVNFVIVKVHVIWQGGHGEYETTKKIKDMSKNDGGRVLCPYPLKS